MSAWSAPFWVYELSSRWKAASPSAAADRVTALERVAPGRARIAFAGPRCVDRIPLGHRADRVGLEHRADLVDLEDLAARAGAARPTTMRAARARRSRPARRSGRACRASRSARAPRGSTAPRAAPCARRRARSTSTRSVGSRSPAASFSVQDLRADRLGRRSRRGSPSPAPQARPELSCHRSEQLVGQLERVLGRAARRPRARTGAALDRSGAGRRRARSRRTGTRDGSGRSRRGRSSSRA